VLGGVENFAAVLSFLLAGAERQPMLRSSSPPFEEIKPSEPSTTKRFQLSFSKSTLYNPVQVGPMTRH